MAECHVCDLQKRMDAGDPWAVARLQTGYVQLHRLQYYRGYTFFSAKTCTAEIHDLEPDERRLFRYEMSEVAHAVWRAFLPVKLNYEALGNVERHLPWHLVPRHADDRRSFAPIWENLDNLFLVWTNAEETGDELRAQLRSALLRELRVADVEIEAAFV